MPTCVRESKRERENQDHLLHLHPQSTSIQSLSLPFLHLSYLSFHLLLYFSSHTHTQKNTRKPAHRLTCPSLSNARQALSLTQMLGAGTSLSSRTPPPLCLSQRDIFTSEPPHRSSGTVPPLPTRKKRPTPGLSSRLPGSLLQWPWSQSKVPSDYTL